MTEELCYKGQHHKTWTTAMAKINDFYQNLFPQIFLKGYQPIYHKVNPKYPKIEGLDKNKTSACIEVFNFVHSEYENINFEKGNSIEQKALEIFITTNNLVKIAELREKTAKIYDKLKNESEEIKSFECDLDVMILLRNHRKGDQNLKEKLDSKFMDKIMAYQKMKTNIEKSLKIFESSSKNLAAKEGLNFDEKFNPNEYLNYICFTKNFLIDNKNIKDYIKEQDKKWTNSINILNMQDPSGVHINTLKVPGQKNCESEEKQNKFKQKLRMFRDTCHDAETTLDTATIEELEADYKEITTIQRELKEMCYDPEIEVSDDWKKHIKEAKHLPREIMKKIKNIQIKTSNELEKRKQEAQINGKNSETRRHFLAFLKSQASLLEVDESNNQSY